MPTRTPSAHAATEPSSRAALLVILTAGLLFSALLTAGPAAAIDDPTRPDARVTHGPSCRPGGVVVEVVAGTSPYAVTLATTRAPGGEDSALLDPGETVVLSSGDVAWGETIDGYLEYSPLDGTGTSYVDELQGYVFTRPAEEDCAAIIAPAAPATVPLTPPGLDSVTPEVPADTDAAPVPGTGALPGGDPAKRTGDEAVPAAPGPAERARPGGDGGTAVDVSAVATAPAALAREASVAPLFIAAVALLTALTGLIGVARRRVMPGHPPARGA